MQKLEMRGVIHKFVHIFGCKYQQVTVQFNTSETRPAKGIKLNIEADAMSEVSVLAVDKSVLLLGTGNDISSDQVSNLCSE